MHQHYYYCPPQTTSVKRFRTRDKIKQDTPEPLFKPTSLAKGKEREPNLTIPLPLAFRTSKMRTWEYSADEANNTRNQSILPASGKLGKSSRVRTCRNGYHTTVKHTECAIRHVPSYLECLRLAGSCQSYKEGIREPIGTTKDHHGHSTTDSFDYDPNTLEFVVRMPTGVHERLLTFIQIDIQN